VRGVWDAIWGLLVEDGSLAIGIIGALALTWIAAALVSSDQRNEVGWLLLLLLVALVLLNLRAAAHRARRRTS
jgi:hypothetical protein